MNGSLHGAVLNASLQSATFLRTLGANASVSQALLHAPDLAVAVLDSLPPLTGARLNESISSAGTGPELRSLNTTGLGAFGANATLGVGAPLPSGPLFASPVASVATMSTVLPDSAVWMLAALFNVLVVLSPLKSVLCASRTGLGEKELFGILASTYAMFAQSHLWACYGHYSGQHDVLYINFFSVGMCMFYLYLIARDAPREGLQMFVGLLVAGTWAFSVGVVLMPGTAASDHAWAFACGAIVANIVMVITPLPQAFEAFLLGSFEQFPWAFAITSFLSSLFGAHYAMIVHDKFYFLPNAFGVVVGLAELGLVAWAIARDSTYRGKKSCEKEEDVPLLGGRRMSEKLGRFMMAQAAQKSDAAIMRGHERWPAGDAECWGPPVRAGSAMRLMVEAEDEQARASATPLLSRSPFGERMALEESDCESEVAERVPAEPWASMRPAADAAAALLQRFGGLAEGYDVESRSGAGQREARRPGFGDPKWDNFHSAIDCTL